VLHVGLATSSVLTLQKHELNRQEHLCKTSSPRDRTLVTIFRARQADILDRIPRHFVRDPLEEAIDRTGRA
jgi:hypothetical protein